MIGIAFSTGKLHGEVFLARRIVVEGVHDKFHVHDLMGIEHFNDLSCIAHVSREAIRMPRNDAIRLSEFALVFGKVIEVFESLDCAQEIVELWTVVVSCAHFLFDDMEDMQIVSCSEFHALRELCRNTLVAVASFVGFSTVDHIVLRFLLHVSPAE
ncbi:MAG TPA: hypothetical protein VJB82_01535 [Candidatus Peribacterales bacterium]|nr:hypothetical protein [Candidatus Peribacterales bacterium]